MGWERRNSGKKRYYTRSRRVHEHVRREYLGSGELASLAAASDTLARQARAQQRAAAAQRRQEAHAQQTMLYAAMLAPLDVLDILCHEAIRCELEAAGYHQHHRGEWRKRREPGR